MKILNKKADLSLNLIIMAIIALIVLVVVVTIFTGKLGTFRQTSDTCQKNGGACIENVANADGSEACSGQYESKQSYPCMKLEAGKQIVDTTKICCVRT